MKEISEEALKDMTIALIMVCSAYRAEQTGRDNHKFTYQEAGLDAKQALLRHGNLCPRDLEDVIDGLTRENAHRLEAKLRLL